MAENLQDTITAAREKIFSGEAPVIRSIPSQPDAWSMTEAKRKREAVQAKTPSISVDGGVRLGSYLGAMWRQDSPVDGITAWAVGNQMAPVPGYVAAADPAAYTELTNGIHPDFHKEFNQATSPAQAQYIRTRLLQKQDDLTQLGDLGGWGIAGRLLFGLVEPSSALSMVLSGGVAGMIKGTNIASKSLKTARTAEDIAGMEKATAALGTAATAEGSKLAYAGGLAAGGGFNAGFEKVRQSVNFEKDNGAVIEAGLVGTVMAAPFVHLHAREMTKLANTAQTELRVLTAIRKDRAGLQLDPLDHAAINEQAALNQRVLDIESGKVDAVGGTTRTAEDDAALNLARQNNTFKYDRNDTSQGYGNRQGYPQPADTPTEKLFSNYADGKTTPEAAATFREKMFHRANAAIDQGHPTPVKHGVHELSDGFSVEIAASSSRSLDNTQVRLIKDDEVVGVARLKNGHIDSIATPAEHAGNGYGLKLLKYIDDNKIGNVHEVADRSPGFVKLQKDLRELRAKEASPLDGFRVSAEDVKLLEDNAARTKKAYLDAPEAATPEELTKLLEAATRAGSHHKSAVEMLAKQTEEDAASGFKGGSIGSGQVGDLGVDPTYPHVGVRSADSVVKNADGTPTFLKGDPIYTAVGRMDIYATLNKQPNKVLQELGHVFIKDAIGNSKYYSQGRTASEHKALIKRVLGGYFHREVTAAWDEVAKIRGLGVVERIRQHQEFFENVSRVTRGDAEVLIKNPDIAGPLNKAAAAQRHVYDELARRAVKAGVEGADTLVAGGNYVNRIWNHENIRKAIAGLDQLYGKGLGRTVLNEALAAASPHLAGDVAKAGKFLDAVRKLEYTHIMQDIQLHSKDMVALRAELAQHLSKGEIDALVDVMFAAHRTEADAGRAANLKYRLDIDESYAHGLKDGSEFRIADLFENDSRLLVDKYINSMGGHIAMANVGYKSRAEFMKRMKEAQEYHAANQLDSKGSEQFVQNQQLVQDMYDHITGRPMSMQSFNKADRFMGAFRAYARSAFLGQLGLAAAFEMKNAMALSTTRAFYQQLPSFREFLGALRSGKVANLKLRQDIEAMTGFGLERVAGYARQHEVTDHTYDKGLTRFENWSNNASHAVDIISGNSHMTSATRQFTAASFIQKHYNMAVGKTKITPKMRERMVHQGINSDDLDDVLKALKDHSVVKDGVVKEIRHEEWQQQHPESYDNYVLALERDVRDAIQDHDIGETMPWMHGTVGKIFGELRTFNLAAHSKQFLKGAHYHDQTTAMAWTLSFMGEAMAYSVQQSLNFAHNPDELNKRLTLERISAAAMQRMAVLGIMPMLLESGFAVASGGDSLLPNGGTANTDNRNLFKTPSGILANKLYKSVGTVVGGLNPLATNVTSQHDVKDLMGTLPGGNTWLMRNLNDYVSHQFPKGDHPK